MRIVLLLTLLLPISVFAQKISSDKIDDFEGKREIVTTSVNIKGSKGGAILAGVDFSTSITGYATIKKTDTVYSMIIAFYCPITTSIDENSTVMFKFDDDTVMTQKNQGSYDIILAEHQGYLAFQVSPDLMTSFQNHKVEKIKISTTDSESICEIKEKEQDSFGKIVRLLQDRARTRKKS